MRITGNGILRDVRCSQKILGGRWDSARCASWSKKIYGGMREVVVEKKEGKVSIQVRTQMSGIGVSIAYH